MGLFQKLFGSTPKGEKVKCRKCDGLGHVPTYCSEYEPILPNHSCVECGGNGAFITVQEKYIASHNGKPWPHVRTIKNPKCRLGSGYVYEPVSGSQK